MHSTTFKNKYEGKMLKKISQMNYTGSYRNEKSLKKIENATNLQETTK